jgi:hypothetical protein
LASATQLNAAHSPARAQEPGPGSPRNQPPEATAAELEQKANSIHDIIKDPTKANGGWDWTYQTVALLRALVNREGPGPAICEDIVASSAGVPLNDEQKAAAAPALVADSLDHAEINVLAKADQLGTKPLVLGVSRVVCIPGVNRNPSNCLDQIHVGPGGPGEVLPDNRSASWSDNILLLNFLNATAP